jgi:predicted transposase/invertase (TIGR01784 family)
MFLDFPDSFFELIAQPDVIVSNYRFTSQEVKQLAFRLDGLFLPLDHLENLPFYLVEVQFQKDEDLYYRLFSELFLYLRQYKPLSPWQIVVIYPSREIEREHPRNLPTCYP